MADSIVQDSSAVLRSRLNQEDRWVIRPTRCRPAALPRLHAHQVNRERCEQRTVTEKCSSGHHSFRFAVSEAMEPSTEEMYVGQPRCA